MVAPQRILISTGKDGRRIRQFLGRQIHGIYWLATNTACYCAEYRNSNDQPGRLLEL